MINKKKIEPADKVKETMLLTQRADEFISIASWQEALAMIEASLLVDANQPDLHYKAVYVLSKLTSLSYDPYGTTDNFIQKAIVGLNYYKLGLTHLESFLLSNQTLSEHMNFMSNFWGAMGFIGRYSRNTSELKNIISEINKEKSEMLIRVMKAKKQSGGLNDSTVGFIIDYLPSHFDESGESLQKNYNDRLQAIEMIQHLPKAREWIFKLAAKNIYLDHPGYEIFINQIDQMANNNVKTAVRDIRQWREKELANRKYVRRENTNENSSTTNSIPDDILLKHQNLDLYDSSGTLQHFNPGISGWLACGDNIDFVWDLKDIYLMKEKGILKSIFHSDERFFNIVNPCFDGKYVWCPVLKDSPVLNKERGLVLAINPVTEEIIEFNENDGLPPMIFGNSVGSEALSIGEICLAGGFEGRGWIAILTINDSKDKNVQIIHEARQNVLEFNATQQDVLNPNIAFSPHFVKVIYDLNDKTNKLIVIGRSSKINNVTVYLLIINPKINSAWILPDAIGSKWSDNDLTVYNGSLYWAGRNTAAERKYSLWQIKFENIKKTVAISNIPEDGFVVFINNNIHIIGTHWWMSKDFDEEFIQLKVELPSGIWQYRKICNSNHYGLVILSDKKPYQAIFNQTPINIITP